MSLSVSSDREFAFPVSPEVSLPLPPEVVEKTHTEEVVSSYPSPMELFQGDRQKSHLGEQALVSAKAQEAKENWNPFSRFYDWMVGLIYGTEELPPDLSPEQKEKILALFEETKRALKAMETIFDEEDEHSFEELVVLIQKKREAEHKRTVVLQGEALKKAKVELDTVQLEIKEKRDQILAQLSSKNVFVKIQQYITPLCGMIASLSLPKGWNVAAFSLSALGAANIAADEPFGDMIGHLTDLAVSIPLLFLLSPEAAAKVGIKGAGLAVAGMILMCSRALTTVAKARNDYLAKSYQGDMGVLSNERRQAFEKPTDLGGKAAKATQQYYKELGALSNLLDEKGGLIQAIFSR